MTAEELKAAFEAAGVAGFAAELDVADRATERIQMLDLSELLGFAKASGAAVTYDVTYFPAADEAEVERQVAQLAADLDLSAGLIREMCLAEIHEYLVADVQRDVDVPVHSIVETYVGGAAFAWYGINEYPHLKKIVMEKLADKDAIRKFAKKAVALEIG